MNSAICILTEEKNRLERYIDFFKYKDIDPECCNKIKEAKSQVEFISRILSFAEGIEKEYGN